VYEDGTVVRISVQRTSDAAYPSGWRYTFHYGSLTPSEETLEDGTIRRYDNAHEDTKGHELHVVPDLSRKISAFQASKHCTNASGMKSPNRNSALLQRTDTHDRT